MPFVHPAELWQATGRWHEFGPVLQKFRADSGREFALGPTAEEVIAMLAAREIDSYKQLPLHVYQITPKYRNEARPRGGLIRLREFIMKDSYSLDADYEGLDRFYARIYQAYLNVFARMDVPVIPVEANTGAMGGRLSHEFVIPHPDGEDSFACCEVCGYAANVEAAKFALPAVDEVALLPVQKVATPDCKTIQEVANFIGVPTAQTLKAVFFVSEQPGDPGAGEFVFVVIRGDLEVNEAKLLKALAESGSGGVLRPATDDEILATGAVPGYASPIGLDTAVKAVADRSVLHGANFVVGANDEGYHLTGVNAPRDFDPAARENCVLADIAEAFDGAICGRCAPGPGTGRLHIQRAIELGHCFKLGTRYSEAAGVTYLDEHGVAQPVVMGSYGIGLERLMAVIIETHHDDWGIRWPASVAPFDAHIVTLGKEAGDPAATLYADLRAAGIDVLLDDRGESPGVKFADADLIGVPLRLTISKKSLAQDAVEVKWRTEKDRFMIPLAEIVDWVREQEKER
jgi:prolyl-tRNA synthetase